jgi:D-alanyl-D-alanine-carboxypeptidase/D-alanyl-D-alanine-endopeptidase
MPIRELLEPIVDRSGPRRIGVVVGASAPRERALWHRGDVPDGPRSIFEIGSITKTFTATLLADMARDGLVGLDDPVNRHLPAGVRVPPRGREITLDDLASHRAGLPALPRGALWRALATDRRDPYARWDAARLEAAVPRTRPRREPQRRAAYSNYGFGLLGYALAFRAGTSYEDLVRERISTPLGMADTSVEVPERDRRRLASGHSRRGREVPHWHLAALAGAGGLRSTADDLLTFLRIHERGARHRLAAAAAETRRPRTGFRRAHICLGWWTFPPRGRLRRRVFLHEGGTGGFRSFAGFAPEAGVAVVVLANAARPVGRLGLRLLAALIRESVLAPAAPGR